MQTQTLPTKWVDNGYPTGDPTIMPESDWHDRVRSELKDMLRDYYADRELVYVGGDMIVSYDEADGRRHLAPDVFVVLGAHKHMRGNFGIWEEQIAPQLVIEVTSHSMHADDTGRKLRIYRDVMRVREYFLFDPTELYLSPILQGYRLRGGSYQRIRPRADGRLTSQVTGLELVADGDRLRLWNPQTQRWLLTANERATAAQQQANAAQLRADAAKREADTAKQQAELAQRQATTAEQRAEQLAAELERLRKQLPPGT